MEKLVYVVWKKPELSIAEFRKGLLGEAARRLIDRGARKLVVNLADEHTEYGKGSRITCLSIPMTGTISIWVDTALRRGPLEEVIAEVTERSPGYLVSESVPIVNTTRTAPLGQRTPGILTIAFLEKPNRLTWEQWREQWQGHHTQVGIDTQSTFLYIQNLVVRPLTEGAPPWTAIVEEAFPREALTDPMVFYDAKGSKEKLRENQRLMVESCQKFIDFDRLESHPMSQYILAD